MRCLLSFLNYILSFYLIIYQFFKETNTYLVNIYRKRFKNRNFGFEKTPLLEDRKRPYILEY